MIILMIAVMQYKLLIGEIIRSKIPSINQVCDILKISRNIANRYLNNDYRFYSKVFNCRIILSIIGISIITKKIAHLNSVNYPILSLPDRSLNDLGF